MDSVGTALRLLAHDAAVASKKRRRIARCLKKSGFKPLGKGWWLGFRNSDVVSGLLIDAPPMNTYVATFILPTCDPRTFITWSLGDRVLQCSADKDTDEECAEVLAIYQRKLLSIRSSADLIRYIDRNNIKGGYAIWATYLSYLNEAKLSEASDFIRQCDMTALHSTIIEKLNEISPYVAASDECGVQNALEGWKRISEEIFGRFDEEFDAFKAPGVAGAA